MNKRNVLRHLKKSLTFIEQGWTQGAIARDKTGKALSKATAKKAVAWCAMGALDKSVGGRIDLVDLTLEFLVKNLPKRFVLVTDFNDYDKTKQKDVVRLFKKCIKKLET